MFSHTCFGSRLRRRSGFVAAEARGRSPHLLVAASPRCAVSQNWILSKQESLFSFTSGILRRRMADNAFIDFVLDQLSALPELRAKAMFGGHGLYQADRFFGILMDARLYFKTDDQSRNDYLKRGMAPFLYEKARRTMTIHYFEVPADVLENREALAAWANRAIQAAAARPKAFSKRVEVRRKT